LCGTNVEQSWKDIHAVGASLSTPLSTDFGDNRGHTLIGMSKSSGTTTLRSNRNGNKETGKETRSEETRKETVGAETCEDAIEVTVRAQALGAVLRLDGYADTRSQGKRLAPVPQQVRDNRDDQEAVVVGS
jgi:hypothetical protein